MANKGKGYQRAILKMNISELEIKIEKLEISAMLEGINGRGYGSTSEQTQLNFAQDTLRNKTQ